MSDNARDTCPRCGGDLAEQQLDGSCPRCMLRKGLSSLDGESLPVEAESGSDEPSVAVEESPGRYTLIGERARGGMGRVLVVHDEALGRDVALKELLPGPGADEGETPTPVRHSKEMAARFLREAKITGQLEHPGITPVHELGRRADGSLYYTMKLVSGRTLEAAIRSARSYDDRRDLLLHFVGLCQSIAYAHSRGVIHRDIKPSNVMIGDYGETVVVDWGLAKVIDPGVGAEAEMDADAETVVLGDDEEPVDAETRYGEVLGTPAYMSPEQARGQLDRIDERSDVYSLGAVLYQILTGRPPFVGSGMGEIFRKVIHEEPVPVREVERRVPRELALICERAMARERAERTPSAAELARQVERAAGTPDVFANPLRPFLGDLVPELEDLTRMEKAEVVARAGARWRRRNLWPSLLQDAAVVGTILFFAAMAMVAFFALVALARDLELPVRDEVLWAAVSVWVVVPFILTTKAHTRSIAPYVRDVLAERGSAAGPTGSRMGAAVRAVTTHGLVWAGIGAYTSILLMEDLFSSPSVMPIVIGFALGAAVEGLRLWRSERR